MWKPAMRIETLFSSRLANRVLGIYKDMWNRKIKEISEDRTHSNDICLLAAILSVIVIIIGYKHCQQSIKCIGFPAEMTKKLSNTHALWSFWETPRVLVTCFRLFKDSFRIFLNFSFINLQIYDLLSFQILRIHLFNL